MIIELDVNYGVQIEIIGCYTRGFVHQCNFLALVPTKQCYLIHLQANISDCST